MAIGVSFFLVYSKAKIQADRLHDKPISVRCQVRYTLSHMSWSGAKRLGHKVYRVQFTTPAKAMPRLWANGKVKHTHPNASQINHILDGIADRAVMLHAQYIAAGTFAAESDYINAMMGHVEAAQPCTLFSDYAQYISYLKDRAVGTTTQNRHRLILGILEQFQKQTGYLLDYHTLNKTFAAKFTAWAVRELPTHRKTQNMQHTVQRYFKDMRNFLSHAHTEGWTTVVTWRQIKPVFKTNPFPVTVSDQDIERMWAITPADLPCSPQKAASCIITRDWFLFGTQTSLRWSDWQAGKFKIIDLMPIGYNLQFTQQKTDAPLEIPLSALAIEILRKYDMKMPQCFCPASTSDHLGILANAAGIQKHITSHTARRTFCTLQEAAGVPRGVVMRITGHRTEKDYLRYTGISFKYNADMMRRANPEMFKIKSAG
jgi:integrase